MRFLLAVYAAGLLFLAGASTVRAQEDTDARLQAVDDALDKAETKVQAHASQAQAQAQAQAQSENAATPATAQEARKIYPDPILAKKNELEVAEEYYESKFHEPGSFSQKGVMSGYHVKYTHRFIPNHTSAVMVGVEGMIADGKFKQPPGVGPTGIKDKVYELRGVAGPDYYVTPDVRVTPYIGYGYRHLKDNSEGLNIDLGDDTLLLGYKRDSRYMYIPFGAEFMYLPASNYSWQGNLEYDYMFLGWQRDKLGIVPGFNDMTFEQHGGSGLRASLRLNLYFKYCTAFAEGFLRYWYIPQSQSKPTAFDPTISVNEAKNTTTEYGLRLGLSI